MRLDFEEFFLSTEDSILIMVASVIDRRQQFFDPRCRDSRRFS